MSPLSPAGAAALSKDKKIGYISVTLDVSPGDITDGEAKAVLDAADPAKKAGLQTAVGGYVGRSCPKRTRGTATRSACGRGDHPAARLRLGGRDGAADHHCRAWPALRPERDNAARHLTDVPTTAPTVATMIGLAVGIDYSLFIVTKHRSQVAQGMEVRESIARAIATAGGAVLFAGGTVAISLLALVVAGIPLVPRSATRLRSRWSSRSWPRSPCCRLSLACSDGTSARFSCRTEARGASQSPLWTRVATAITNHPWPVMAIVLAVLLALSIPAFPTSRPAGHGRVADRRDGRQAYDLITKGFGAGTNGPFLIAVNLTSPPSRTPRSNSSCRRATEAAAERAAADRAARGARASRRVRPSSRSRTTPRPSRRTSSSPSRRSRSTRRQATLA